MTLDNPDDWPLVEPAPAPEIFVDGYQSTMVANGVIKFTFFSVGFDPVTQQRQRRIVLHLAAPITTVAGVHQAFGELLDSIRRQMEEGDSGRAN